MAGRPRRRARMASENGADATPTTPRKRKDFERKSPETIAAEQASYKAMVLGFLEELTEDGDAWQTVVNVCNLFGTSISENNLVLMMAQYAGFTAPNLPPTAFPDGHVPTDVRHFHAWRKVGRIPRKGMGVKMWEPVRKDLDEKDAEIRRANGEKGIKWDADRKKWVKLTFKLGTRWDVEHTELVDADAWANSDPRPAREGGAELAAKIADSIFDLFGVDVTIPPTPAEQAATRKRRAERPAEPRKPAAARPDDTATFTPPTRRESRPLFGPAPTTPPDSGPGGGADTAAPAEPGAQREGTVRPPESHARALPAGAEGEGPDVPAPSGQDEAAAFLRNSGYRGNWATMSKAAYLDLINATIARADQDTNGRLWSAAGQASSATRHDLWTMPEGKARKFASPELIAWWGVNGRMTVAEYRADLISGSGRSHRAASGF